MDPLKGKRTENVCHFASVEDSNKAGKICRVCNADEKYKNGRLNDKLLVGPDLINGLIETIFRFRKGSIVLTADVESMFLNQVQVPERDKNFLIFLSRQIVNDSVQT